MQCRGVGGGTAAALAPGMTKMTNARQGRLASPRALVLSLATVAAALASGCVDDLDVSTSDKALTQVVTPIETGGATRSSFTQSSVSW